jgi:hypothetical protein
LREVNNWVCAEREGGREGEGLIIAWNL